MISKQNVLKYIRRLFEKKSHLKVHLYEAEDKLSAAGLLHAHVLQDIRLGDNVEVDF